ncbi:MAG TPA: YfiR family protein [Burkholderiales bacterium]|nr:YfiR family protein [Burkholderiales bacterium]
MRIALAALVLAAVTVLSAPARAQQAHEESRVKAAFLLRFGQFVQWPQDALPPSGGTLTIAVAGSDAMYAALVQQLAERGAQGRPTVVRQLKSAEDLAHAHMLFIGNDAKDRIESLAASAGKRPILIVTESADAMDHGSMINFIIADRRVRFEIALDSAERAGLTLSSRLLAIAARVHRGMLGPPAVLARVSAVSVR